MLIWWILSLIILIVCLIFAYRMIASSYEFLPANKRNFTIFSKSSLLSLPASEQHERQHPIRNSTQSTDDYNSFYQIQFTKLQERLKILEDLNSQKPPKEPLKKEEPEEDWKEMYFEENELKEKIENELDVTRQALEETREQLNKTLQNSFRAIQLQSDLELRLQQRQSLQEEVDRLKTALADSARREKELEQLLMSEITIRERYTVLQNEFNALQREADELRRRIVELGKKDVNSESRTLHLEELETKLALCEEEKFRLKSRLDRHLLG